MSDAKDLTERPAIIVAGEGPSLAQDDNFAVSSS